MQWDVAPIKKLSYNSNVIMHNKIIPDELYSDLYFLFHLYNKNIDVLYGICLSFIPASSKPRHLTTFSYPSTWI
jgi:hypothetical protein